MQRPNVPLRHWNQYIRHKLQDVVLEFRMNLETTTWLSKWISLCWYLDLYCWSSSSVIMVKVDISQKIRISRLFHMLNKFQVCWTICNICYPYVFQECFNSIYSLNKNNCFKCRFRTLWICKRTPAWGLPVCNYSYFG